MALKRWFVYVLVCADRSYYTGSTTDLAGRLIVHNSGKGAAYTRARLPVRLVYCRRRRGRSAAQILEAKIKRLSHSQKRRLIREAKSSVRG